MNANFEYNRFHAQSKIQKLQQEGILSQQLKQPTAPKASVTTKTVARPWLQALRIKLFRLAYS